MKLRAIFTVMLLFLSQDIFSASKETFAQKYSLTKNQIFTPQRITVGSEDNYQSQVSNGRIFYTKGIRLSKRIFEQDLETGQATPFIDDTADSKDPAISPDGKHLAFTFSKFDAKGDICFVKINGKSLNCITGSEGREMSPFWLGNEKIGYMSKDPDRDESDVIIYDLKTKEKSPLFSGRVLNPRASKDGGMITFIKVPRGQSKSRSGYELVIRDTSTGREHSKAIALPGISSFPVFSPDNEYIYFGHFTNDTSGDMVIDSDDRAIIFRIKLAEILSADKSEIFPEPLSSLEHNCNFPDPYAGKLYITCAFNESLDVYSLPGDGVIPKGWDNEKLMDAHRTSRSYEDRILALMYLAYRDSSYRGTAYYEKLLSNYYIIDERNSSRFVLSKLTAIVKDPGQRDYYSITDELLKTGIEYESENPNLLTDKFRKTAEGRLKELKKREVVSAQNRAWINIVSGCINYMLGRYAEAGSLLQAESGKKIDVQFSQLVRAKYLERLFLKKNNKKSLALLYGDLALMTLLDEASRVYYAYRLLDIYDGMRAGERKQYIKDLITRLSFLSPSSLKILLDAETLLDDLSSAKTDENIQKVYDKLFEILKANKDNYYLKRALFVRSIKRLSRGNLWRYMYYVANYWLSTTDKEAVEYSYARDQYLYTSLDKAYGLYSEGKYSFAGDEFYIAMRLTDDLEAHHGFIYSKKKTGKDQEIEEKYKYLFDNGYTYENIFYKQAYVLAGKGKAGAFLSSPDIDKGIRLLEKIDESKDRSGVKNLFLGYLYYKRLDLIKKAGLIKATADNAYRNLMLAADLGRYNLRIRSQALMNLGLLQQKIGNFAASLSHFEERKEMPFSSNDHYVYFLWFYARAYYHQGDSIKALEVMEEALKIIDKNKLKIAKYPINEKCAFYSMAANNYERAKIYYERIINIKEISDSGKNAIKINTAYAYVLYKLNEKARAREYFRKVYRDSKGIKFDKKGFREIFLSEHVYTIQALGYLAIMEPDAGKRLVMREERLGFLLAARGLTHEYGYSEESWNGLVIKEMNNIADCYHTLKKDTEAMAMMDRAIPYLEDLYDSSMNPIEDAYILTLQNYMSLYILVAKKALPKAKYKNRVTVLVDDSLTTLEALDDRKLKEKHDKLSSLKKKYMGIYRVK